jgi:hypothetical protein
MILVHLFSVATLYYCKVRYEPIWFLSTFNQFNLRIRDLAGNEYILRSIVSRLWGFLMVHCICRPYLLLSDLLAW